LPDDFWSTTNRLTAANSAVEAILGICSQSIAASSRTLASPHRAAGQNGQQRRRRVGGHGSGRQ
jgi:hypothetical protein